MSLEFIMITAGRFVSKCGSFSIAPIYQGGTLTKYKFALDAKFNGKNKVYNYVSLEDAFKGVQHIYHSGYTPNPAGGRFKL